MAFRSSATAFSNTGSVTLTATPAGVAVDDYLAGFLAQDSTTHGAATPVGGWGLVENREMATPDSQQLQFFEKTAAGGDSFTTGIVLDANSCRLDMQAWSGRATTTTRTHSYAEKNTTTTSPLTVSTANATSGTVGVASAAGDDVMMIVSLDQQAVGDVWSQTTNPSAYTERQDNANDWINLASATRDNVAGGGDGALSAVHTRSVGTSGSGWQAITITLRQSAAADILGALTSRNRRPGNGPGQIGSRFYKRQAAYTEAPIASDGFLNRNYWWGNY